MSNPLRLKMVGESSITRSRETVNSIWFVSLKPGASTLLTSQGAANQHSKEIDPRAMRTKLATAEARRHAPLWSRRVKKSVKVGKKAEAKAPAAMRLKSVSGSRLAA